MRTTDSRRDATADTRPHSSRHGDALDAVFDALSDRRCRTLLGYLADSDDDAGVVSELAAQLADASDGGLEARAKNGTDEDRTVDERRLRAILHHTVLPRLADAGLVDYDADRGVVRYRADSPFETIRSAADFDEVDADVSLEELFDLLASFRRRTAYRILLRHEDLTLADLADEVAIAERDEPLTEIDADAVLEVYLSLYHTHVPKLAAADVAAYEQETDSVALTETGRALESPVRGLLDAVDA